MQNQTGNLLAMFNSGRALGGTRGEYLMTRAFRMSAGLVVAPWVHPVNIDNGQDVDAILEVPWVNEPSAQESPEHELLLTPGLADSRSPPVASGSDGEGYDRDSVDAFEDDFFAVTPVEVYGVEEVHIMQEEDLADYSDPDFDISDLSCMICMGTGGAANTRCCADNANHLVCSACLEELRHRYASCPFCRGPAVEWDVQPLVTSPDPHLVLELSAEEEGEYYDQVHGEPESDDDRDDDSDYEGGT